MGILSRSRREGRYGRTVTDPDEEARPKVQVEEPAPRGVRRARVAFHVLVALLHGRARNWISNLPDDVEVVHVGEDLRTKSTAIVVLSSADREGPEEGGVIPDIEILLRDL